MNLLATKKYAARIVSLEPGAVIPITEIADAKNLVITLDGHIAPLFGAKKVIRINDPLLPVKGYV